jgi:hypothetical protein
MEVLSISSRSPRTGVFVSGAQVQNGAGPLHTIKTNKFRAPFLENYRDFCCLNFRKVLSLLYIPLVLRMGLIWLRKCRYWFRQMIAHDYPIEQSNG